MQRSTHEPSAASAKGTSPQVATGDNEGASPQVATDVMGPAQSPRVLPDSWRASFSIGKTKSLPAEARTRNLALVLQTIYADGPLSRADLARATHLTKVTISDLVARLMGDGLVQEVGADQYLRPGKPAVLLDLVKDAFAVGCLDLSDGNTFKAALFDLNFTELKRISVSRVGKRGTDALEAALDLATNLVNASTLPVIGLGVGSPGVVSADGMVRTSMSLGWTDIPLTSLIEERTGIPTIVENDANAATIAESAARQDNEDLLFVSVWSGIGAGLVLDGGLLRGQSFASGEIGRLTVGPGDTSLEEWISLPALDHRLGESEDADAVFTAAGEHLAVALAPIVAMLNLTTVVLNGPDDIVTGPFIEATNQSLRARTMSFSNEGLQVAPSQLGTDVVLLGCAWLALNRFLENHNNR